MEGFHNSCKKIYVLENGLIIVIKLDKINIKEKSVFCNFWLSTLHNAIPHIFIIKNAPEVIQLILKSKKFRFKMSEKISFSKACVYWNFKGLEEDTLISAYDKFFFYPFLLSNLWLTNKGFWALYPASTIIRDFLHVQPPTC